MAWPDSPSRIQVDMRMLELIAKSYLFVIRYNASLYRFFITFIDNTLVYIFNKKPIRAPLFVGLDLTFRCNANCKFCDSNNLIKKNKEELSAEKVINIIRQIGKAKAWHLTITGGEALLRKDLYEIIKEAKQYGLIVNLNTNGFLLSKYAAMLVNSGIDTVTISVDSIDWEIHDRNRGIPGLYYAILKGIDEINGLKIGEKPQIIVRIVVSKQNVVELEKIAEFFLKKDVNIAFQPIHEGISVPKFSFSKSQDRSEGLFNIKEPDDFLFSRDDRDFFRSFFDRLMKSYSFLNTIFHREFEHFIFDKNLMWERYKCFSGFYYITIDPYGDIYPCWALVRKIGSLRHNTLLEIWRSREMNTWRKFVKNKGNKCLCWCGTSIVNAYMSRLFENRFFIKFYK